MVENEEELKSLLMKINEETGKAGLKLNIKKKNEHPVISSYHFMENIKSGNSDRFYFLGLQNHADSDFRAQKIKSVTVSILSLSICHEVMEPDAMILVFFLIFSFKPVFFTLLFHLHQEAL